MKSLKFFGWLLVAPLSILLFVNSCLNPLDFDPEDIFDAINVTGDLDVTDVTSAVLMPSNRTKNIKVTGVTISHYEGITDGEEIYKEVAQFNGRPKPATNKAQYVKPSDNEYKVAITYINDDTKKEETKSLGISAPMPKEIYWLYLYHSAEGEVVFGSSIEDIDPAEIIEPAMDKTDIYEGEGSIPWYIPPANWDHIGVFVVVNMTKDQNIDYVQFSSSWEPFSADFRSYWMVTEPRRTDQQGIALGMGSWLVNLAYTQRDGFQRSIGPKNATVLPLKDTSQSAFNYMYFYKNRSGSYDISFERPDVSVMDPGDNVSVVPPDYNGYGKSVIRIVNQTDDHVIQGLTIVNPVEPTGEKLWIDFNNSSNLRVINPNAIGTISVSGTQDFNLHNIYTPHHLVIISLWKGGQRSIEYAGYYRFLIDQLVEIVVRQQDIEGEDGGPGLAQKGTRVRLANITSNTRNYELNSVGIYDANEPGNVYEYNYFQFTSTYGRPLRWGKTTLLYMTDNPYVPIVLNSRYRALVTVYEDGIKLGVIDKEISPDGNLFGNKGDPYDTYNHKEILILDQDIDDMLNY